MTGETAGRPEWWPCPNGCMTEVEHRHAHRAHRHAHRAPVPVPDKDRIEYAVMCADGRVCHRNWQRGPLEAVELARDVFDAETYSCGPHRVVQRTVTPWEDVPDAAMTEGESPQGVTYDEAIGEGADPYEPDWANE